MFKVLISSAVGRRSETSSGGRSYRNAALTFLLHPVHHSFSFVNFADLVRNARIEKDALGNGGFPSVNVSDNTNISDFIEWI